ncbi:hypothetical protein F383_12980 [Gossypium arboreum]|uniref:Uncharacterized protein n=3 Tax=Gossypium TaxID=3633 RepID=A0A0B0NEC4_GOSAR|nr:hypothetical protein F383_12980 [Gossypium arboreum]TYG94329.1 hypothetical protein ES288_A11G180200v1 [Gossypium darwinii]TYI01128.1 hypothetical protein ES332_A11G180000v1 [Gossypium tomentosum]
MRIPKANSRWLGEGQRREASVLVQQDKGEPNLERRTCRRGTWGMRR